MPPKTPTENEALRPLPALSGFRRRWLWLALLFGVLLPSISSAYYFMGTPPGYPGTLFSQFNNEYCTQMPGFNWTYHSGLALPVVSCIKETFASVVKHMLLPISDFFAGVVALCCTIAVMFWGAMMAMGKRGAPTKDLAILGVKITLIGFFSYNFGGAFPVILDFMEELLGLISGYANTSYSLSICPNLSGADSRLIWQRVDCTIAMLIGGIGPISLLGGITGFLLAASFSGTFGLFIATMGFLMILQLLLAIARAIYIFLTSYMAISVMVLVSPLFVPMMLFSFTKPYFDKWLKLLFGFIFQPIFLFAFLFMMLAAFDTVVYRGPNSLKNVLAPDIITDKCYLWADFTGSMLGDRLRRLPIYGVASVGSETYNYDTRTASEKLKRETQDTGILSEVATQKIAKREWQKGNDQPKDVFSNILEPAGFTKADVPGPRIDWEALACINGYDHRTLSGMLDYAVTLLLSFLMAMVTAYMFMTLINLLPYIGSGSGDVLSAFSVGLGGLGSKGNIVGMMGGNK